MNMRVADKAAACIGDLFWEIITPEDADCERLALLLVDWGDDCANGAYLVIGKWSGASWWEHDDLSWHGPVKMVAAHAWMMPRIE